MTTLSHNDRSGLSDCLVRFGSAKKSAHDGDTTFMQTGGSDVARIRSFCHEQTSRGGVSRYIHYKSHKSLAQLYATLSSQATKKNICMISTTTITAAAENCVYSDNVSIVIVYIRIPR